MVGNVAKWHDDWFHLSYRRDVHLADCMQWRILVLELDVRLVVIVLHVILTECNTFFQTSRCGYLDIHSMIHMIYPNISVFNMCCLT